MRHSGPSIASLRRMPGPAGQGRRLLVAAVLVLRAADARRTPYGGLGHIDQDSPAEDTVKDLWGSRAWPLPGKDGRPPTGPSGAEAPWDAWLGGLALVSSLAVFVGMSLTRGLPVRPVKGWKFAMHLHALVSAIVWRHLHRRALLLHALRVAVPAVLLLMIHRMRDWLAEQISQRDSADIMALSGSTPEGVVDGVVEYTLTVTMVYVVMMSMVFFVWHVAAESQSGFRHLLHVSGLSRPAYMLATAGFDGVLLALLGLLVMLFIAGGVLQVRMVLWTSPTLFVSLITLLSTSAIMTGYLLHFLCPSARLASTMAQVVMLIVTFSAPFAPMGAVVPAVGQQPWKALALPTIPAYRAVFELVAGCVKGRCLTLGDVADAISGQRVASPWTMLLGAAKSPELTPAESLVSFTGLVVLQLVVGWVLILLLDMRLNPALHDSGAQCERASASQDAVLEARGLVHWYGLLPGVRRGGQDKVLDGVSFSVGPGAMLGLLGPNGAGKTTTIRCITGEERPSEGSVAINAAMVSGSSGAYIGLCPQETVVNSDLTVAENLLFFACVRGKHSAEASKCVEHLLAATSLRDKRDWLPDTLSGGMRRRLAVGCAMIATPAVAILDEPTTGLDPVSRRGIWGAINEIKAAGGCCLLTTHMLEEAEALCSHIVILTRGRKAAEGSVQQLKDQWGNGYLLSIDCWAGKDEDARKYVASLLSEEDRTPIRSMEGQMTFKFSREEEALGHFIIAIARGKAEHGIRHWGISQASLEDAYIRIIQQDSDASTQLQPEAL